MGGGVVIVEPAVVGVVWWVVWRIFGNIVCVWEVNFHSGKYEEIL